MNAADCPCGSGLEYSGCCEPLHLGGAAPTAEALMRSRFSAFALSSHSSTPGLARYLLSSWHPSTRPAELDLADGTLWRRLQIVDRIGGEAEDATGVVEFRASFRTSAGSAGLLHERSRFARVDGRWAYLDGELLS